MWGGYGFISDARGTAGDEITGLIGIRSKMQVGK